MITSTSHLGIQLKLTRDTTLHAQKNRHKPVFLIRTHRIHD